MRVETMTEELFLEHFDLIKRMVLDYDAKAQSGINLAELLDRMLAASIVGTTLLIFDKDIPKGFVFAELVGFDKVDALDIVVAFNNSGKDGWEKGWEAVKKMAKDFECEKIICESRVGRKWEAYYLRKLKKLGFRPAYMRYSMEVK